jgi:hypothetical protein
VYTGFWLRGPGVRAHWEDLGVGGRIPRYEGVLGSGGIAPLIL